MCSFYSLHLLRLQSSNSSVHALHQADPGLYCIPPNEYFKAEVLSVSQVDNAKPKSNIMLSIMSIASYVIISNVVTGNVAILTSLSLARMSF